MADFPEIVLEINDLSRGGAGVAREPSGRAVFVPFAMPGDRVRVRLVEESKRYAQAELLEVLEPSPQRQTPPCPVFGKCGGCQWQHIPYETQWQTKVSGVLHSLSRVQLAAPGQIDLMPAERIWNYRNRIQLRGSGAQIGFYAARSHELVAIDECRIARPELNAQIPVVREEGKKLPAAYKVELEVLDSGEVRKIWNSRHAAGGFRQVHDEQNEKLRSWVTSQITQNGRILDLFGGSGNLGAPVSLQAESVDCVDVTAPEGTSLSEFPKLRFHKGAVSKWLARAARSSPGPYSSAILDPPREGLGDDFQVIAESLEKLGVRELVAVGCDSDSWARDLSRFARRKWKLHQVGVLDLFPQTPHVEALAVLKL